MNFRITGILGDLTAFLTILAALPYELGTVAEVFPPDWKKHIAITGAIATVVLRLIKRAQVPPVEVAAVVVPPAEPLIKP